MITNRRMAAILITTFAALPQAAMGQELEPLSDVLATTHVHGLAPQENTSDVLMATHHGVWSVDLENETAQLLGDSRDDFMGFSTHPTENKRYWASGHPVAGGNMGVIESVNGGETWSKIAEGVGGPVDFHQMTVSGANPEVLYGVHHGASLQKSTNSGRSWEEIGLLPDGIIDLAASGIAPDALYAATNSGLFKSGDAGRTWIRIYQTSAPVSSVEVDANGVHAFVLGVGVVHSPETDLDFSVVADDFEDTYLLHLTPMREGGYVAATDGGGLVVLSSDGSLDSSIP